jgi:hypothetical protein
MSNDSQMGMARTPTILCGLGIHRSSPDGGAPSAAVTFDGSGFELSVAAHGGDGSGGGQWIDMLSPSRGGGGGHAGVGGHAADIGGGACGGGAGAALLLSPNSPCWAALMAARGFRGSPSAVSTPSCRWKWLKRPPFSINMPTVPANRPLRNEAVDSRISLILSKGEGWGRGGVGGCLVTVSRGGSSAAHVFWPSLSRAV